MRASRGRPSTLHINVKNNAPAVILDMTSFISYLRISANFMTARVRVSWVRAPGRRVAYLKSGVFRDRLAGAIGKPFIYTLKLGDNKS